MADPSAESEPKQEEGQVSGKEGGRRVGARPVRKTSSKAATEAWLHTEGQYANRNESQMPRCWRRGRSQNKMYGVKREL